MVSVNKDSWIPHTNVSSPTFEGDNGDDVWWMQNQQHPSITCKIRAPFTKYASCTCEWAL